MRALDRKLVRDLHRVRVAMGDGVKRTYESEKAPMVKMGKRLVAAADLPPGHQVRREDVAIKSPGGGLQPYELEKLIGRVVTNDATVLLSGDLEVLLSSADLPYGHAGEKGGKFKLTRASTPGNRTALQSNLATASAFLNRENPSASILLAKAVTIHGDSGVPPIKDRQQPSYRHLEEWARTATINPVVSAPAQLPASVAAEAQPLPPPPPTPWQPEQPYLR